MSKARLAVLAVVLAVASAGVGAAPNAAASTAAKPAPGALARAVAPRHAGAGNTVAEAQRQRTIHAGCLCICRRRG